MARASIPPRNLLPATVLRVALTTLALVGCHRAATPSLDTVERRGLPALEPLGIEVPDSPLQPGELPLLAGRWVAHFPLGSRLNPMPHAVMNAPNAATDETRVWGEAGNETLVTYAFERFHTLAGDFLTDVRTDQGTYLADDPHPTIDPLPLVDPGVRGLAIHWGTHPAVRSYLVTTAYLVSRDGTVQVVQWYVSEPAWRSGCAHLAVRSGLPATAGCSAVTMAVARSLRVGPRPGFDLRGGRQALPGVAMSAVLPPGWAATPQPGGDFTVVHFRQINPLGNPDLTLGLYVGQHPQDPTRDASGELSVRGRMLGAPVTWNTWNAPVGKGLVDYHLEAQQPLPGYPDTMVHVWGAGFTDADRERMRAIGESLVADAR